MARSGLWQSPETGRCLGCEGLWGLVDAGRVLAVVGEDAFQGLLHAVFSLKGNLGMETGSVSGERPCWSQPSFLIAEKVWESCRERLTQPPVCHLQRAWLRNGRRIYREVDSWLDMVGEGLAGGFISSTAVILLVELVVKLVVVQMTDSMM